MLKKRQLIVFPREVLLVEIERHCAEPACNARTRVGLTKEEARLYNGFECGVCERWHEDGLTERDIPDWWEELTITGLQTLRTGSEPHGDTPETNEAGGADNNDSSSEVVARLSAAWQSKARLSEERGAPTKHAPEDGGDESV